MGQRLMSYYDQAKNLGGLKAQMRLSMITKLPSSQAVAAQDSPDVIKMFEQALTEIKKEFC